MNQQETMVIPLVVLENAIKKVQEYEGICFRLDSMCGENDIEIVLNNLYREAIEFVENHSMKDFVSCHTRFNIHPGNVGFDGFYIVADIDAFDPREFCAYQLTRMGSYPNDYKIHKMGWYEESND